MAAPVWGSVVGDYIDGMSDNSAQELVNDILKKNVTILQIIEHLGPSLTKTEASVRARAVRLIADVLHGLPSNHFTDKEVELLCGYMMEKLKDHHSVQPHAIYGLLALSSCECLPDGVPEKICRAIFGEVFNQSLAQGDRRNVYQIFLNFLTTRMNAVKTIEGDFVHSFIQVMDMEKDPRNLVLAFKCVQLICHNLSLGVFVEEMFEVFSCYFPVDFTPPPGDVYGVKKGDLVSGLQGCMAGSPKFSPFALPLFIEKMNSDLHGSKIEAFNTLAICANVYGATGLEEFLGSLFSVIKREVFSSGEMEVEESALNALTAIVKTLANSVSEKGSRASMDSFIHDSLKDCLNAFREPGLRQFHPTARLAQSMAGSCEPAYCKVLHMIMPTLLEQLNLSTQVIHRLPIVNVIQNFIRLSSNFCYDTDTVRNPLLQYCEQIFTSICELLLALSSELRHIAVTCLTAMISAEVLEERKQTLVADHFTTTALNDLDISVREASTSGLGILGQKAPPIIINKVLPTLVKKLQISSEPMDVDGTSSASVTHNHITTLQTIVSIATHEDIVIKVVPHLVDYVTLLSAENFSEDVLNCCVTGCKSILSILERNATSINVVKCYRTVISPQLIELTVQHAHSTHKESVLNSQAVLTELSSILQKLTCVLPSSDATDFCEELLPMFIPEHTANTSNGFHPLELSSPWKQTQVICILMAVVSSVPQETRIKQENLLMEKLTDLSLRSDHEFTSNTAAMFLSAIINKLPEGPQVTSHISQLREKVMTLLTSEISQSEKQRAMVCWIWLTKALVLRGFSLAKDFTNQLLTWFENNELGEQAAGGFKVILSERSEVMTPAQHSNIRFMYKQRLFVENFPKLVEKFNSTEKDLKRNYLLGLSSLVSHVPKQVLLSGIDSLLPLLMHSLECEDRDVQLSTLSTLSFLMSEVPDTVGKHVDTLIPRLVTISTHGQTMKSRIHALKCMSLLCGLPAHLVLPHKSKVVKALEPALDDRKRLVRREAVEARGEWFLLGAPVKS